MGTGDSFHYSDMFTSAADYWNIHKKWERLVLQIVWMYKNRCFISEMSELKTVANAITVITYINITLI